MKVLWIYLAVASCLSISTCFGGKLLEAPHTKGDKSKDRDSRLISKNDLRFIGDQPNFITNERKTLTTCPLEFGIEGIYLITVPGIDPFPVLCNAGIAGAGYIVIASRSDVNLNFFRNWTEYKKGFGDLFGDFFIGLDKLHAITKSQAFDLYVHLEDFDGNTRFARYDEFYIENENELYRMSKLGAYSGDAGDSLATHRNQKFTTYDRDNDQHPENCAILFLGGWWYNNCHHSNLFGMYLGGPYGQNMFGKGMDWRHWRGNYYSLKNIKMMIRPKYCCT